VRRITKAALSGFAGCALLIGASQAANSDSANMTYLLEKAPAGDFQEAAGPFDLAEGTLRVSQAPDDTATGFKLTVENIEGAAGQEFGAHLHTGPCVDKDYTGLPNTPPFNVPGGQAGPHYNDETATTGNLTPAVNPQTEVWFNLVPNDHGQAVDDTKVQFVPDDKYGDPVFIPGEMSM
jgi:hypothetical protein